VVAWKQIVQLVQLVNEMRGSDVETVSLMIRLLNEIEY